MSFIDEKLSWRLLSCLLYSLEKYLLILFVLLFVILIIIKYEKPKKIKVKKASLIFVIKKDLLSGQKNKPNKPTIV